MQKTQTFHNGKWHTGNYSIFGVETNASWLGMSVFDGARSFQGVQPDLELHCRRSIRSANYLKLRPTIHEREIAEIVQDGIKKFRSGTDLYIRIEFWDCGSFSTPNEEPGFCVVLKDVPLKRYGFSATTTTFVRPSPDQAPTHAKASCLYPNSILAERDARARGFDNAILCDHTGAVAEFTMSNIFYVKDGEVHTPKPTGSFLNGITRQRVIKLLKMDGYTVHERRILPQELNDADEIFSTGNANKVQPVTQFLDRELGEGIVSRRAWELYLDFAHS